MRDIYGSKLSKTEEINVRCGRSWYNGFALGFVVMLIIALGALS